MIFENKKKLRIPEEGKLLILEPPAHLELSLSNRIDMTPSEPSYSFAILFAISINHLNEHAHTIVSACSNEALLWIAYPKKSSSMYKDLNRDFGWHVVQEKGLQGIASISLNSDWSAVRFRHEKLIKKSGSRLEAPELRTREYGITDTIRDFLIKEEVYETFKNLTLGYQHQYLEWLLSAKREETRERRLVEAAKKLRAGFRQPYGK